MIDMADAYTRYAPELRAFAARLGVCGPLADADDIVQQAFEHLLRGQARYTPNQLRALLYAITRSRVVDAQRTQTRRARHERYDEAGNGALFAQAGTHPPPDERSIAALDARSQLVAIVARAYLTPMQWHVLIALVVRQRALAEVADELGTTVGAVKSLRSRALERLRDAAYRYGLAGTL